MSCGAWSAKHSRSGTEVRLSGRAKYVTPADTRWRPCFARQRQRKEKRGGRAKWKHRKWATVDRKPGRNDETEVAVTERYLARTLSDRETPFSPTDCSGIDSTMAGSWQRAGVNEEKAANSVLQRWTEGPRDGAAYRDMTAMHPADSADDRAASPRRAGRPFGSSLRRLRKSALAVIAPLGP